MNDERPIEKLLRRYAKERRADAGAPLELHPATRRLLQGEVARQLGGERHKPMGAAKLPVARPFWHGWLPRLAWVVPMLALVTIGAWRWLGQPATQQLALGPKPDQKSVATPESDRLTPKPKATVASGADARLVQPNDPAPTPVSIPTRALNQPASASGLADQSVPGKRQETNQALAFAAAPNPPVASLAGVAEQKSRDARVRSQDLARADKEGIAPTASPAAPRSRPDRQAVSAEALSSPRAAALVLEKQSSAALPDTADKAANSAPSKDSGSESAQTYAYSQAFARQTAPLKEKVVKVDSAGLVSPVLTSFRVEQSGRQLRVVDSDGSTYTGEAEPVLVTGAGGRNGKPEQIGQLFKSGGKLNQLPAGPASAPQPPIQNHAYRVVGTNRTLNQNVVFTWSFVEMTNQPVMAQSVDISSDLKKDLQKLPAQFPAQLQNSFINGRAQLGTGKEIEINAVPVSP